MAKDKLIGEISASDSGNEIIGKLTCSGNSEEGYFKKDSEVARFALLFAISKKLDIGFDPLKYKSTCNDKFTTKWHYSSLDDGVILKMIRTMHTDIEINEVYITYLIDYTLHYIDTQYLKKHINKLSDIIK